MDDKKERCCWEWEDDDWNIKRCRKRANEGGVYCDDHCKAAEQEIFAKEAKRAKGAS